MISIKLEAASPRELVTQMKSLIEHFYIANHVEPVRVEVSAPLVVEEKKEKKTKAKKTEEVKVEEFKVEEPVETVVATAYTKEDVVAAAQNVTKTVNLEAATAILNSFMDVAGEPCKRLSALEEKDFSAFIAKCKEAVK